ncbi:hypothetical protein N0V82_008671 [Gnomoniopsis sp. IMI 355080]|nr:hypothetical protein N0V82_008671 [Gnomoniopsis sp. IMI 355080]
MATGADAKLLKSTKFPPEFSQKVDMTKVNLQVMKKWIAGKISEILGSEDDVVIELCFNLIEGPRFPDIKSLQIQLTGFLDKDTAPFCKELWNLCLSAQTSPQGVPKELLEAKKMELIQEKASRTAGVEGEEAIETHITDVDAASVEGEALRDHLHPVGVVVATPSEAPVGDATLTCPAAEDPHAATTDDAGLRVGHPHLTRHDRALGLALQAMVVVDVDPDLIFERGPDLLFVERITTDQVAADVHPLPRPHLSADDTPPLEVGPQISGDGLGQDHLHDRAAHRRAGDAPGTAAVEVPQPLVLGEEKTEADTD